MFRFLTCSFAVTIVGSSLWSQVGTDSEPMEPTILNRSPFIPPGWEPPKASGRKAVSKKSNTGYEFRGVYQLGNEYRFLVSAPRSHNGKWVTAGTEYEDYEVRGYDPASETLTLFYDSKEEPLKLAKMDANPTPMAVSGQVRKATTKATKSPRPATRRTIRPTSRAGSESGSSAPPPPAWLQKLREEAAERRSQAGGSSAGGAPQSGIAPSGSPGSPAPTYTPPSPPQELLDMDIPPPPSGLPPTPPPDVLQKIQDSIYNRNPGS